MDKHIFTGKIISNQPRIRLLRSFDETSHTYLGYAITLEGEINNQHNTFLNRHRQSSPSQTSI